MRTPIEFEFTVGESQLFGLLIDDPADPQIGYDTAVISTPAAMAGRSKQD